MGTYLTKGTTFTTGDSVTAASLNNLVDNATVTAGSIGSTELATNAVTADKISTASPQPVTTGTIRNNAVDNTKLEDMGSQTVKVRSTNSTGDPSNLPMIGGGSDGSSKLLVGTSDSINAVVADEFKLVNSSDANVTNNTAAKLRLHTTAITGQTDLTSGSLDMDNDRLLIFDESPTGLAQVSPKKLIQSLPATATATGAVQIASGSNVTDPFNATTVETAFSPTQAINCPAFCKAFGTFANGGAGGDFSNITPTNAFNIKADPGGGATAWGIRRLGVVGDYTAYFDVNLPSTNYIMIINGWFGGTDHNIISSHVTSTAAASFDFSVYDFDGLKRDPTLLSFVIFGT